MKRASGHGIEFWIELDGRLLPRHAGVRSIRLREPPTIDPLATRLTRYLLTSKRAAQWRELLGQFRALTLIVRAAVVLTVQQLRPGCHTLIAEPAYSLPMFKQKRDLV